MPNSQPLYWYIKTQLSKGKVIPFLGAGASFGDRLPDKTEWREKVDLESDKWNVTFLPTASELAECLAREASFPSDASRELAAVAQYYATTLGRRPLVERLNEIFSFRQAPGALHRYLAEVARQSHLLIVTTNYDDLIERAFDAAQVPYDTVIHSTDPMKDGIIWRKYGEKQQELLAKDLDIDLGKVSVVYKVHGAIDRAVEVRGQYVITEDDYIDFITRMTRNAAIPNLFAEPFQSRPFLFLGYGLYDWNLRVVLNRIEKELRRPGDIKSWAIEPRSKPLEKTLWERRDVTVYDDLTLDKFVENLRNALPPGQNKT
jgi:hypothetical protein